MIKYFLKILEEYVDITIGLKKAKNVSIAPKELEY